MTEKTYAERLKANFLNAAAADDASSLTILAAEEWLDCAIQDTKLEQSHPALSQEQRERLIRIADIIGAVHRPGADPELHEDDARFLRNLATEGGER